MKGRESFRETTLTLYLKRGEQLLSAYVNYSTAVQGFLERKIEMAGLRVKGLVVALFCLVLGGSFFCVSAAGAGEIAHWRDPVCGIEFVRIPGGSFLMGQSEAEKTMLIAALGLEKYKKYCACECPRHRVRIDGFWLSRCEITNRQFRFFKPDHDSGNYAGLSLNGADQPVVRVTWEEARAFAAWLSQKTGHFFRLPTEAEWEYACRAGTATIRYWREDSPACHYANVADLSARRLWPAWTVCDCNDGFPVTAPVGRFQPNAFGLYDMLGNVWEWCADWYVDGYYARSPENNPPGAARGRYRIARGSCWDNPLRYVRSASRNHRLPTTRNYGIGFRLLGQVGNLCLQSRKR